MFEGRDSHISLIYRLCLMGNHCPLSTHLGEGKYFHEFLLFVFTVETYKDNIVDEDFLPIQICIGKQLCVAEACTQHLFHRGGRGKYMGFDNAFQCRHLYLDSLHHIYTLQF